MNRSDISSASASAAETARKGYQSASKAVGDAMSEIKKNVESKASSVDASCIIDDAKGYVADAQTRMSDVADQAQGFFRAGIKRVNESARERPVLHTALWGAAAIGIGIFIGRSFFSRSEKSKEA